jgi:DNA-binding MarR family transcriptional regulator
MTTEPSLSSHIDQATEIVRDLICLRPHLKVRLPEDLARAKARLAKLRPEGKTKSGVDHDLLFQVGVILARQQEPLTMGEFGKALDVPLSTATRIVDWWVKSGYVERSRDPKDRRIVRVALTKAGRELVKTGNKLIRQRVELILRRFTAEERQTLVVLLHKLVESLANEKE